MPIVIIAEAPLISLWLNPTIPPLVGARCSIHIFAMVLVMIKSSQDLGLGILTGIIWTDEFALVQFFMILCGLFETIFVHACIRLNHVILGLAVDKVFRKMLPFILYPCLVSGWVFKGLDNYVMWAIFSFGGMSLFTITSVVNAYINFKRTKKKREAVTKALRALQLDKVGASLDDEMTTSVMKQAFDTFDVDKSGKLEKREVRLILDAMYANLTRKQCVDAMKAVQADEIPFEDFALCVDTWHNIKHTPPPPKQHFTIMERLGLRKKLKKRFNDAQAVARVASIANAFGKAGEKHRQKKPLNEEQLVAFLAGKVDEADRAQHGLPPASPSKGASASFAAGLSRAFKKADAKGAGRGRRASCTMAQKTAAQTVIAAAVKRKSASRRNVTEHQKLEIVTV